MVTEDREVGRGKTDGLKAGGPGKLTRAAERAEEGARCLPGEKSPGLPLGLRTVPGHHLLGLNEGPPLWGFTLPPRSGLSSLLCLPELCLEQCCFLLYPTTRLRGNCRDNGSGRLAACPRRALSFPLGQGTHPIPPPWPLTASTLFSPADVALYGGREARERPERSGDREPLVWHHGVLTLEVRVWERRAPGGRAPRRRPLPSLLPAPASPAKLLSLAHPARTLYSDEEIGFQTGGDRSC